MGSRSLVIAAVLCASIVVASPDPQTITTLSPDEISAYDSAFNSWVATATSNPVITSIVDELAANTSATSAFNSLVQDFPEVPTDASAISSAESEIAELPAPASSFYMGLISQEFSIEGSVLRAQATTTSGSSFTTSTTTTSSGSTTASVSLASSSESSVIPVLTSVSSSLPSVSVLASPPSASSQPASGAQGMAVGIGVGIPVALASGVGLGLWFGTRRQRMLTGKAQMSATNGSSISGGVPFGMPPRRTSPVELEAG